MVIRSRSLAIKISEIKFFKKPIEPETIIPNFNSPQSFCYVDDLENVRQITNYL